METYLRKLIQYQTVSGDFAENDAALDYLEAFFDERGLHVMRFRFNGFGALVATVKKGDKTPKAMLGAHLDVVPAAPEMFELRIDGDAYRGRGTFDMKFAIATYMQLIDELAKAGTLNAYDIGVMITTDEEMGGANGVKQLIELGYKPDVCILPDAGPEWQIETLAKGVLFATVETSGVTGHGSRPWLAESATFKLIDFLAEVKQLFEGHGPNTSTLNVSMLGGGKALTQIPDHAKAGLDIRLTSKAEYVRIRAELEALCKKHGAVLGEEIIGEPCITSLEDPLVKPFADIMAEETGIATTGEVSYGATDARYFAAIHVPCIVTRPPAGGHHGPNEWISRSGIETFHAILQRYLDYVAQKTSA